MQALRLSSNAHSGSIPGTFGQLTNLRILRLSHNRMEGVITAVLAELDNLDSLFIDGNAFSGCLNWPSEDADLPESDVILARC